MKKRFALFFAAACACALLTGAAQAQTAEPATPAAAPAAPATEPAPKPKAPKKAKPAGINLLITNGRTVALTSLQATPADGGDAVKIAGPLKAGAKAHARLKRGKGCNYTLAGEFEDGGTSQSDPIDLCKTPKINLTD